MKWATAGEQIFDNRTSNTFSAFCRGRIDSADAARFAAVLVEHTAEVPVAPKCAARLHLNVGGTHFEVARVLLEGQPETRLGQLACFLKKSSHLSREDYRLQLLNYCDDFRFPTIASNGSGPSNSSNSESSDCPTFYFERDSTPLLMLLNFYRTGKLHVTEGMCVINFAEELKYWKIQTVRTCK